MILYYMLKIKLQIYKFRNIFIKKVILMKLLMMNYLQIIILISYYVEEMEKKKVPL